MLNTRLKRWFSTENFEGNPIEETHLIIFYEVVVGHQQVAFSCTRIPLSSIWGLDIESSSVYQEAVAKVKAETNEKMKEILSALQS